jgi:hypothetical protein
MNKEEQLFEELLQLITQYSDAIVLYEDLKNEYTQSILILNEIRFEKIYEDLRLKENDIKREENRSNFLEEKLSSAEMDIKRIEDRKLEIETFFIQKNKS